MILFGGSTNKGQQKAIDQAVALHDEYKARKESMALTRDFKQTVVERVARLILRDLVNATVGFESLAELTHKPSNNLHRMLPPKGNPSMDNLAAIFGAVWDWLNVVFDVRVVETA